MSIGMENLIEKNDFEKIDLFLLLTKSNSKNKNNKTDQHQPSETKKKCHPADNRKDERERN